MIRSLALLSLLSTSLSFAQPVEGPFVVMEGDTNLKWPYIVRMEGSLVEIIYVQSASDSDRIRSAAYDFSSHSIADTNTMISFTSAYNTRLLDVETINEDSWIGALHRHWGGPHQEIHAVLHEGSATSDHYLDEANLWYYGTCTVVEWFQEFRVSPRPDGWGWSVGAGHTNPFECFPVVTPYVGITSLSFPESSYPFYDHQSYTSPTYVSSAWNGLDRGSLLVTSQAFEDMTSGTLLFLATDSVTWVVPPFRLDSVLATLDSRLNDLGELIVVSGISISYATPTIVRVDSTGVCQLRSSINWTSNPTDVAWNNNYGIAILRQSSNDLSFFRTTTDGAEYLNDNIFYVANADYRIISSDVQISGDGTVFVLWKENTIQSPYETSIKLMWFGWNTPLSSDNPHFILPPSSFTLSSYPNPFNSTTTITYDLPHRADVELTVYDITGRRVQTLWNGAMNAGEHRVALHAADLPSGIYFAHLSAGDTRLTQKLMLLK